jgi:hypothetical protein
MMPARYFRMFDPEPRGVFELTAGESPAEWNRKGFGIFWTVNEFNGPRRIENLTRVAFWAVDLDDGTKAEQLERIQKAPLIPSLIVETKRGYQVYYRAKDGRKEHWNAIVLHRLVPYFGADKNARDLARILRVPGFLHLKDPANPFQVKTVFTSPAAYTEWQMVEHFPDTEAEERAREQHHQDRTRYKAPTGLAETFWDRVYELDCLEGLSRLSGHPGVSGEQYTFRRNASGTHNILVDGKGTSCWVDRNGRIGSLAGGGPTLFQWLKWFRNSPGDCAKIIKQLFPHLEDKRNG